VVHRSKVFISIYFATFYEFLMMCLYKCDDQCHILTNQISTYVRFASI